MRCGRKIFILCFSGLFSTTILSILSYTSSSHEYDGFNDTADLIGESVRSALLSSSRWELFAELLEFQNTVFDADAFTHNSRVFFESYNRFVSLVDLSTGFIAYSYPGSEIQVTSSSIDIYTEATKSTGESYIVATNDTNTDLLYFSPVKTNGSVNSVVVVGVDSSILLASETSLTMFVDVVHEIRLGAKVLYTSSFDNTASSHVYHTELFTGLDLRVSFWEPEVKPHWFSYFLAIIGGIVSIGIVVSEYRHEKTVEISERKTQFLARMSHEIRTPMNGIIGMSDVLIEEEGIPEKLVECVRVIGACSKHLLHLINNILDLSKIESEKIELHPEVFKTSLINEIVHDTWLMVKRDNGVSLQVVYENVPFNSEVTGDTLKIKQVISNLVTNAVKFTHKGSITVYVQWVDHETWGKIMVSVTVVDTGIGIPKNSTNELFKPYTQMSNNNLGQGTGIGLTISRSLAVALGGGLSCRSEENKGSEFTFKFVVAGRFYEVDRVDVTSRKSESPPQRDLTLCTNPILALVVDDNRVNIQVLQRLLSKLGVTCHTTDSGRDAISMCGQTVYDVVFIDKYMPECDGMATTKILRRQGLNTDTVIIFCTADVSFDSTRECLMSGGTDCLPKPVTSREVFQCMSKHGVNSTQVS